MSRLFGLLSVALWAASVWGQSLQVGSPAKAGFSVERLGRIDAVMNSYVTSGRLAGASGLIVRNGQVAFRQRWGDMKDDSIVRVWSMGKVIAAVAALTLFEEGRFSLDDPVSKYLPEFSQMKVSVKTVDPSGRTVYTGVPAERPITILDLFRHTSGLSYLFPLDETGRRVHDSVGIKGFPCVLPFDLAEFTRRLATVPLAAQPGSTRLYGYSTDVLGRVMEVISGKTLDVLLAERIFQPLHMTDSGFFVPESKWSRLAVLYTPSDGCRTWRAGCRIEPVKGPEQDSFKRAPRNLMGGVGMVSTLDDYARFCMMLLSEGKVENVRVLGRKTVELMRRDFLGDIARAAPFNLSANSGFGLMVATDPANGKSTEPGSPGVYYWYGANGTYFWIDPSERMFGLFLSQLPFESTQAPLLFRRLAYAALE